MNPLDSAGRDTAAQGGPEAAEHSRTRRRTPSATTGVRASGAAQSLQRLALQSGDLTEPDVEQRGDRRWAESTCRVDPGAQLQHEPKTVRQGTEAPLQAPQRGDRL